TGVAGSFALNIVTDASTEAVLGSSADVNAGTGTVTLKAQNTTESIVEAKASAEAGNTGVGVSVGINVAVDNDTRAAIDGKLTGGADVTVQADGSHTVNTTVTAGGLSKGGTGVGGAIAITVAESATEASIAAGDALDVTGKVEVDAQHHGASATLADGKSSGGTAVGAAIALSFVDDSAKASTARDITAGGSVSFTASADGASKAQAIASAAGTDKAQEDGKGKKSSDDQQKSTTDLANAKSGKSKTSGQKANTDSKGDDSGSVGVAAALALNVASSDAEASVGAVTISAGGKFGLKSENHMDASAIADGSAAKGEGKDGKASDTAVGVAVAINVATMHNDAKLTGTEIDANGVSVQALMKDVGGNQKHEFAAKATSGGSGGDTGVAGSFALNIVTDASTEAVLGSSADVNAGTGTVTLKAQNTTESIVEAKASAEAGNTGVGVSVGLNIAVDNDTRAAIDGKLTGGSDLTVEADGSHTVNTTVAAG